MSPANQSKVWGIEPGGNERYPIRPTKWYQKSFEDLGPPRSPDYERVLANLQQFETEWSDAAIPVADIASRWDYKRVGGAQGTRVKLYEFRPIGDIRIFLTLVDHHHTAYYLEVFRKKGKESQNNAIERCLARAQRIWSMRAP